MIRWLWDTLIWPPRCDHDWELLKEITRFANPDDRRPSSFEWVYRCKCCGKANKVKT